MVKSDGEEKDDSASGSVKRGESTGSLLGVQFEPLDDDRNEGISQDTTSREQVASIPRPPPVSGSSRENSSSSAAGGAGTRPPLGPSRTGSPPRGMLSHRRMASLGEESNMSAVSDVSMDMGSPPPAPPAYRHDRKISWGDMNAAEKALNNPPVIMQSDINLEHSSGSVSPTGKSFQLSLADLKRDNPMEHEAETTILRALEERDLYRRARLNSGILSHVPPEGANAFQSDSEKGATVRVRSPRETENAPRRKRSTDSSGHGDRHLASAERMADPLETKLVGLTHTLMTMHDDTSSSEQTNQSRLRTFSRDSGTPTSHRKEYDFRLEKGAGECLLNNASTLLRRPTVSKEEVSPRTEEVKKDVQSRWHTLVADVVRDRKKTDAEHPSVDTAIPEDRKGSTPVASIHDLETGNQEFSEGEPPADQGPSKSSGGESTSRRQKRESIVVRTFKKAQREVHDDFRDFGDFLAPRKSTISVYLRTMILLLFGPAVGVAAILFYWAGNPDLGREGATISWLILYLVRCCVTFTMAKATEIFVIDYLSLRSRVTVNVCGPILTLLIVQSKGFPFILFAWSIYNFVMLSGRHDFAKHWLFYQNLIGMFNEENEAGTITESKVNYTVLSVALVFGICVAVKRVWLGLYFGKRTYVHYGDQLVKLMNKVVDVCAVAAHARKIEKGDYSFSLRHKAMLDYRQSVVVNEAGSADTSGEDKSTPRRRLSTSNFSQNSRVIDSDHRSMLSHSLSPSQKVRIIQILGAWEEPESGAHSPTDTSINAILQFRQALTFMDSDFPFSVAFGPAERRASCIESSQNVYERLLLHQQEGSILEFSTIAELAVDREDALDEDKLKDLVRLFRPDRGGHLSMIDFVKSVDAVYKEMRLLRASIANSGQIDTAFEIMFNVVFYVILGCLVLAALGLSPLALFLSFSSILLAFAFMIGSASAKYFEGILFILRRPFDIGDRIHVSDINTDTSADGSMTWFVENVTLFTTTVRLGASNEVATIANGSLASSRVINAARSLKACVFVRMKFGVDIDYSRVQLFKQTVENFVKDRPREWIGMVGMWATKVAHDEGYIEYALMLQHRESWQSTAAVFDSRSAVSSFCLEVAKKLDMRYRAPPLPVNLSMIQTQSTKGSNPESILPSPSGLEHLMDSPSSSALPDVGAIAALFNRSAEQQQ